MKYYKQKEEHTCGAACVRMILEEAGTKKSENEIINLLGTNKKEGTRNKSFSIAAEKLNLNYITGKNVSFKKLKELLKKGYKLITCYFLVSEDSGHYAVIKKIDKKYIYLLDPWFGPKTKYSLRYFRTVWRGKLNKEKAWFFGIK